MIQEDIACAYGYKNNVPKIALEKFGEIKYSTLNYWLPILYSRFGKESIVQDIGGLEKINIPSLISAGKQVLREKKGNAKGRKTLEYFVRRVERFRMRIYNSGLPDLITSFMELDIIKSDIYDGPIDYDKYASLIKLPKTEFKRFGVSMRFLDYEISARRITPVRLPKPYESLIIYDLINFQALTRTRGNGRSSIDKGVRQIFMEYFVDDSVRSKDLTLKEMMNLATYSPERDGQNSELNDLDDLILAHTKLMVTAFKKKFELERPDKKLIRD